MKLTVSIVAFKPFERNTLRGFATIALRELGLTIKDVAIHQQGERRWAHLPSKPRLDGDQAVKDQAGKLDYVPLLSWTDKKIADAFSARVIAELDLYLMHQPIGELLR